MTIEHPGCAPQHLSSAQAQVAFARLVLERAAGTSRDHLADTVWPDGLPDTWASALRSVVSRVRAFVAAPGQAPGVTPLIAQGGRYVLRLPEDAAVDLEAAESAVGEAGEALGAGAFAVAQQLASGAIANLRGSFLPDHEGEWVNGVREHVDELRMSALETASLSASALGEEHHALRFADEAVRRAPFRESAYRCRMAALAAAGNRAEALRCYQQLRRVLVEELGIDPAPETQELYLGLLRTPAPVAEAPAAVRAVDPVLMGIFEPLVTRPAPAPAPGRVGRAA
ncbi:BTAD domain-containing putative transcriptional regulator [Kitasatospora sp. NPDC052868]|uniref:AfsR/SARP family transcriptional regulator n=1 Tax=Kitasatospora sp. NPDC052868 TaxID=3364060 RepID=UPI0037CC40D5